MTLMNRSKNQLIVSHLEEANTFWPRLRGLLGRSYLDADAGMFFDMCTSIHTFFMKFSIDVVFVDKNSRVVKTFKSVKPGRLIWPILTARAVYEFAEGAIARGRIEVGDELHFEAKGKRNVGH
jgi:uncharacterized protein